MEMKERLTIFALMKFQSLCGLEEKRWKSSKKVKDDRTSCAFARGRFLQPSVDFALARRERSAIDMPWFGRWFMAVQKVNSGAGILTGNNALLVSPQRCTRVGS